MKKLDEKRRLLELAIDHLEELVSQLREESNESLNGRDSTDEGGFSGNMGEFSSMAADSSRKDQALLRRGEADRYAQMANVLRNYSIEEPMDKVGMLSMVVTNHGTFFISRAIKPLHMDGKTYYMIAPDAPIYGSMLGLRKGDKFSFRGIDYAIEDVY
ncbi:MAG: hypothetical protein LPK80_02585 [Bacteroidota bacterium]|nr:hypothetical protein [Bacteroidota bacterium]MDX5447909.1 hypothetical protein [Bacteroidota bacterium]